MNNENPLLNTTKVHRVLQFAARDPKELIEHGKVTKVWIEIIAGYSCPWKNLSLTEALRDQCRVITRNPTEVEFTQFLIDQNLIEGEEKTLNASLNFSARTGRLGAVEALLSREKSQGLQFDKIKPLHLALKGVIWRL